jgi:hypothetical protein
MRTLALIFFLLAGNWGLLSAQRLPVRTDDIRGSIPPELATLLAHSGLTPNDIDLRSPSNPFYLSGDFDGDGLTDYAVTIFRPRTDRFPTLAIVCGVGVTTFLTPDSLLQYPGNSSWYVWRRSVPVPQGHGPRPGPLLADAIYVREGEASSGIIYWNGRRFVSYWLAD